MTVRAKFRCEFVTNFKETATISLAPVTGGSEENKKFFKWTPGGKIELAILNPDAAAQFIPGKDYYVDFTSSPD